MDYKTSFLGFFTGSLLTVWKSLKLFKMNLLPKLLRFRILSPKLLSSPPPLSLGEVAGFLSLDFILQLNTELHTELSMELDLEQ